MNFGFAAVLLAGVSDAKAQTSNPPQRSRPNVLVVLADDWSYDHASTYGCKWVSTPNFDRVCREGVSFSRCFTSNPKCFPSRASILSGRNTWQLGAACNHFGKYTPQYPNYVDLLEDAGYFVGFTGKGCSPGQTVGFHHANAAGKEFKKRQRQPPHGGLSKNDYMANFEDFLKERPSGSPFCFWLGISEPHRRYERGSGVGVGKKIADVVLPEYYPDNDEIRSDFLDYAVEVEWFDEQLGKAMALLDQRGELDSTLVLVTSDHGMPFPRVKGNVYEDSVHVPLAIRWGKQIPPGRIVDDFINVRDLAPTILEVAGLDPDPAMTGKSLSRILASDRSGNVEPDRDHMLVGKERHSAGRPYNWGYPVRGIRTDRYLYKINHQPDRWPAGNPETGFQNCDRSPTKELLVQAKGGFYELAFGKRPAEELFDLTDDPHCTINLAADPKRSQVKEQLRNELLDALREEGDPRTIGDPSVFLKPPSNRKYLRLKKEFQKRDNPTPNGKQDSQSKQTSQKNKSDKNNEFLVSTQAVDFSRQIRPILSSHCFVCHGPDEQKRESDLRLDQAESTLESVVVPGNVDDSELHQRIRSNDPDMQMPPANSKGGLSESEKDLLDRWIAQGAKYDAHWSLIPPRRRPLPKVSSATGRWVRNGIDHFVAAGLKEHGLRPSPEASPEQLVRRVTLDLTGLPPTIQQVDRFLADASPGAYGRLVDRLLASQQYGERMALVWMDAARYADSGGYQADVLRTQWPWRDWVIDAYNQNMPFDQFTIDQLAGDLRDRPTQDQILATAFNRNHRINNEGGIIPEEWRVEYVCDRVETTSTVWLGLTVGCARCHDHKYDPISQRDYYRMFAFFNNVDEKGRVGTSPPNPTMSVYSSGTAAEHRALQSRVAQLDESLEQTKKEVSQAARQWIQSEHERLAVQFDPWNVPTASLHVSMDGFAGKRVANVRHPGDSLRAVGKLSKKGNGPSTASGIVFKQGQYLRGKNPHRDEKFRSDQPLSWVIRLRAAKSVGNVEGPIVSVAGEPKTEAGYRVVLEDPGDDSDYRLAFRMFSAAAPAGIEVVSVPSVKRNADSCLAITYDGSGKASGVKLYVDGQPVSSEVRCDTLDDLVETDANLLIGTASAASARQKTRDGSFQGGRVDDLQFYVTPLDDRQVESLYRATPNETMLLGGVNDGVEKHLLAYFASQLSEKSKRVAGERKSAAGKLQRFEDESMVTVCIISEMETPRETWMLMRGAYDNPDKSQPLAATTLGALPAMSPEFPENRMGLARWLFQDDHPLTARVAINRYWQMYFAAGLVKTPEDFGSQGAPPSHPDLLDWLSIEFRDSGWDVKAMQKMIVTSATYRQSSAVSKQLLKIDPDNRLLGRGPRFRLYGQALRDQALAVSGLLVSRVGGPPVMPYQPEGLWEEVNAKGFKYIVGKNDDLYRRSMYTFWRRTVPPPSMMSFDSSAREVCSVKTNRTNTPLQALNFLNDPQFVEAARRLAERMIGEGGESPESRIKYGHRLVLARDPGAAVLSILRQGYNDYLREFRDDPSSAKALIATGQSQPRGEFDDGELAALTAVANVLLNLDETVTRE